MSESASVRAYRATLRVCAIQPKEPVQRRRNWLVFSDVGSSMEATSRGIGVITRAHAQAASWQSQLSWESAPSLTTMRALLAENGRHSSHLVRSDCPKFKANSREKRTSFTSSHFQLRHVFRRRGQQSHHHSLRRQFISEPGRNGTNSAFHDRGRPVAVEQSVSASTCGPLSQLIDKAGQVGPRPGNIKGAPPPGRTKTALDECS